MNKIIKAVLALSILGISSYSILQYAGGGEEGINLPSKQSLVTVVEARLINESMYQKPYESEGITTLVASSLSGIEINSEFKIDNDQNLLADAGIKDMFDLYLSTLGEYDLEQVIATIQENIKSDLSEPARSQALDLLKRYIDYKIGLSELQEGFAASQEEQGMIETLLSQQAEVSAYRKTFFNMEEYEAFFDSEDRQNDFLIEQLRISRDTSLTTEEKQQLLSAAEQKLPEEIQFTRKRAQQHALLGEKIREMKASEASQAEIFNAREQVLGSEAAVALADLDRQRELWSQRLAQFADERSKVMESSLSEDDKERSVSQLLAYHFSDTEQKRVSALLGDGRL
jgi:lipase chaperone LimK